MRWALAAAASLHGAALALLVLYATPRPLAGVDDEPAGIIAVFSHGGGGEEIGRETEEADPAETAHEAEPDAIGERPSEAVAEAAPVEEVTADAPAAERSPAPEDAPPFIAAALPLPPPPPPEPPPPARSAPAASPPAPATARGEAERTAAARAEADASLPGTATAGLLLATREATVGRRVDPVWPIEARRARMQGTVVLAVTISPEGVPAAVDVLRSSGHFLLDRAAQEALWQWRFDPARRGGVAVEERIAIPVTFRLTD